MKKLQEYQVDMRLTEKEINAAERYFFKKATSEVKNFISLKEYQKISFEKDDILYYSGRILPTENVNGVYEMSTTMKDLSSSTFCVPIIYKHSPLA